MHLTNWQEAQLAAEKWQQNGEPPKPEPIPQPQKPAEITLEAAWDNFIARAKARNLKPATIYKYELLRKQMAAFGRRKRHVSLHDFTLEALEDFQGEWKEGPLSRSKKLERLKAFFRAARFAGG
jgi:hypothetical protein